MELKNYDELVEELIEMLKDFDKQMNKYQTDVYLYYDPETQTGELDTFVNVGGNSWLNDDHITIYRDKEHLDDIFRTYYQNEEEIASVLDITADQLIEETYEWRGWNMDDYYELSDVEYCDIIEYCKSRDDYMDLLQDFYESAIDNSDYCDYESEAQRILDDAIVEYGDRWEMKSEEEEAPVIDNEIEF